MKIEHVAFQVPNALEAARWYVAHLGLTVRRRSVEPPYGHFLADDGDGVMLEIYSFAEVETPDYRGRDPREVHIAFEVSDVAGEVARLTAAGAEAVSGPETVAGGDEVAMLRDPWGVCLQLVRRSRPLRQPGK